MSMDDFEDALRDERELLLTVVGRSSKREISLPVWFCVDEDVLRLLPVRGSKSSWYRNLLKNKRVKLSARGVTVTLEATSVSRRDVIEKTVQLFRKKYGEELVKRYYSVFNATVEFRLKS